MKLDRIMIAAVVALMSVGTMTTTAQTQCAASKCAAKTQALPNPATDPSGAWNQGDEPFAEFMEMWVSSPRFRADRSQNAKMATCTEDGEIVFSCSNAWSPREVFNMACGGKNKAEMKKDFTPCKATKVSQNGQAAQSQWVVTDADIMVYDSTRGGQQVQMIFQRIDGQWQLTGVMMEG